MTTTIASGSQDCRSDSPALFTLKDFSSQGRAYFSDDFDFEEAAVNKNLRKEPRLRELLTGLADKLEQVEPFNAETSKRRCVRLQTRQG
jgi:hypothetical protein